jgi:hypothetical protein
MEVYVLLYTDCQCGREFTGVFGSQADACYYLFQYVCYGKSNSADYAAPYIIVGKWVDAQS